MASPASRMGNMVLGLLGCAKASIGLCHGLDIFFFIVSGSFTTVAKWLLHDDQGGAPLVSGEYSTPESHTMCGHVLMPGMRQFTN